MQYRRLGRTELHVSVLSLGTGGPNRLGQSRHVSQREIRQLIGRALDLGINLFDTSSAYENSESILGGALLGVPREHYIMASKIFPWKQGRILPPQEIRRLVERSLRRLRIQELDILHLHRVTPETYKDAYEQVIPELARLRDEGKFRYLGITESTTRDPQHRMLHRALQDNLYDAIMVAYHPALKSAEQVVFPLAQRQDVGVICMAVARQFVHRNALARLQVLGRTVSGLVTSPPANISRLGARLKEAFLAASGAGQIQAELWQDATPEDVRRLPEAAYAFALRHPAVASVLTGTTNPTHLERNVLATHIAELPDDDDTRTQAPPA